MDITFVDDEDNVTGPGTKEAAKLYGIRHRIVHVILTNSFGDVLIQKRSLNTFAYPGKWDVSAAGHVDYGEEYMDAAQRELREEVGVTAGLIEIAYYPSENNFLKRFNKVYTGIYDGDASPNSSDVSELKWVRLADLQSWLEETPDDFTPGSRVAIGKFIIPIP